MKRGIPVERYWGVAMKALKSWKLKWILPVCFSGLLLINSKASAINIHPNSSPTSPGQWSLYPNPGNYSYESVAMVSSDDGWMVGGPIGQRGSAILRWNGNAWSIWRTNADEPRLYSIGIISPTEWQVVGRYGGTGLSNKILHWKNGSVGEENLWSWRSLKSILFTSPNEGWAVGKEILRWNGGTWLFYGSISSQDDYSQLESMVAFSANDIYAVGSYSGGGLLGLWNGTSWSIFRNPTTTGYHSICALTPTDIWTVGMNIYHNGENVPSNCPDCVLYSCAMVSTNNGWAVGEENNKSVILHWDGISWSKYPAPEGLPLRSISMISACEGWTVGDGGTIFHYLNESSQCKSGKLFLPLLIKKAFGNSKMGKAVHE